MVVGELSRNFNGEYVVGPSSAPAFASLCGTYATRFFANEPVIHVIARFFKSKSQLLHRHQKPALFFRAVSVAFAVAGVAAAVGWWWSNRRFQRNVVEELDDDDNDDDNDDGVADLDLSQDEPITPSASGGGARGGGGLPCVVCFERKRRVVCNPCRHFALCVECARRTWDANGKCPCCRADLDGFTRVFLA
jgi:hypothetical protein